MKVVIDKLSEVTTPLTNKWMLLPDRDRFALSVLSLFMCIALFFFLIWKPLQDWSAASKLNYENKQALVQWIEANYNTFLNAKGSRSGDNTARQGRSVLSLVNQEARLQSLNIKRVEPKNNNQLRVWVDGVKFDDLLKLLHAIESKYSIGLLSVGMEKGRDPGLVNATLVLRG